MCVFFNISETEKSRMLHWYSHVFLYTQKGVIQLAKKLGILFIGFASKDYLGVLFVKRMVSYILVDYAVKPTFASFLPAVPGYYGFPCLIFLCERRSSTGVIWFHDARVQVLKIYAANKAHRNALFLDLQTYVINQHIISDIKAK